MNEKFSELEKINYSEIKSLLNVIEREKINTILLNSPSWHDIQFWTLIAPSAEIYVLNKRLWDLSNIFSKSKIVKLKLMKPKQTFDLVVLQNVLMYSKNPTLWLKNLAEVAKYVLVQDLRYRIRSKSEDGLGGDGDVSRFCLTLEQGVNLQSSNLYCLDQLTSKDKVLGFKLYEGGVNEYHSTQTPPIHIAWITKGVADESSIKPNVFVKKILKYQLAILRNRF